MKIKQNSNSLNTNHTSKAVIIIYSTYIKFAYLIQFYVIEETEN